MIQGLLRKIKRYTRVAWNERFLIAIITLLALASFGLGRLSVFYGNQERLQIITPDLQTIEKGSAAAPADAPYPASGGGYVASRNGSKYHFPWCSGAQAMNEENKVWFETKEEAEAAGYTPAGNCRGL